MTSVWLVVQDLHGAREPVMILANVDDDDDGDGDDNDGVCVCAASL